MNTIAFILYIVLAITSLVGGFIANGDGTQTVKLSGIFGGIAMLSGLISIIYSIFIKYWIGIIISIILYLVFLNIGGAIMRAWIRKLRSM